MFPTGKNPNRVKGRSKGVGAVEGHHFLSKCNVSMCQLNTTLSLFDFAEVEHVLHTAVIPTVDSC